MDSQIQVFNNPDFGEVRTTVRSGEPWFIGKDIAVALGYSNPSKAVINHVDEEDKCFMMMQVSDSQNGNLVKTALINESGLYSLVLSSKLPTAKKFKRWVTSDVLPSIRKHGVYATPATLEAMISDPDTTIRILQALKDERAAKERLEAKVAADRPKVAFAEAIEATSGTLTMNKYAKAISSSGLSIGHYKLMEWLRAKKILRQDNTPYQRYMNAGYFEVSEYLKCGRPIVQTFITGKGQTYIYKKLMKEFGTH